MSKKNKKNPAEELIRSVIDDLNDDEKTEQKSENEGFGAAFLGVEGIGDEGKYEDGTNVNPPVGMMDPADEKQIGPTDKTIVATPQAKAKQEKKEKPVVEKAQEKNPPEPEMPAPISRPALKGTPYDAQLVQAENLKMAQQRILELEKDLDQMRRENEVLASAGELAQQKAEELLSRIQNLERVKFDLKEQNESELKIFKDGLVSKDSELHRLRAKVEELESRLSSDVKRVRVRERELENRLELAKMEKTALLQSKDEAILDLKRKIDQINGELGHYKNRVIELTQTLETNQEKVSRTVRALRLALTNLEVDENTSSITLAPLKKAE